MLVHLITEGILEIAVGTRLINHCEHELGTPYHNLKGAGQIQQKAHLYIPLTSCGAAVLVLTDFTDSKCSCATEALCKYCHGKTLPHPFLMRFAVQELESWLLADTNLADFLVIPANKLPANPETESDPKRFLINLARKSNSSTIIKKIVPSKNHGSKVGLEYTSALSDFILNHWDIENAMTKSPSLARCVAKLRSLTMQLPDVLKS